MLVEELKHISLMASESMPDEPEEDLDEEEDDEEEEEDEESF